MKVKDLKEHPAEYNPRQITEQKLEMLGKSMKAFGDISGIVFNKRTGNLVCGHQRIKHLDDNIPIKTHPFKDQYGTVAIGFIVTPEGKWVYRLVDWDQETEILANISANQQGGEFDYIKLKELYIQLDNGSVDMELTGFSPEDMERIITHTSDEYDDNFSLPSGDKDGGQQMTFKVSDEQAGDIKKAISKARPLVPEQYNSEGSNKNGNALHFICLTYLNCVSDL
jgi:hypothetical protein